MLELPFKRPPRKPDTIEVGDEITGTFDLPRRGSLTVDEDLAYTEAVAEAPAEGGALLMAQVRPKLAAIALRRIMPELTDEDMAEHPLNSSRLQEKLTEYLMAEKAGNVPPEPPDPKAEPQTGATSGSARRKLTPASTPASADDGPTDTTGTPSAAA